jgi:hypothetical protein
MIELNGDKMLLRVYCRPLHCGDSTYIKARCQSVLLRALLELDLSMVAFEARILRLLVPDFFVLSV